MRILFSIFSGAIVTILLFVLMMVLIKTSYAPQELDETITGLVIHAPIAPSEEVVRKTTKPKLKSSQSPPASSRYLKNEKRKNRPDIAKPLTINHAQINFEAIKLEYSLEANVSARAPNTSKQGNNNRAQNIGANNGNGYAGTGLGSGSSTCTMGFTVTPEKNVENIQWYNCMGKDASDSAEARLYAWLYKHPHKLEEYSQNNGQETLLSFNSIPSTN